MIVQRIFNRIVNRRTVYLVTTRLRQTLADGYQGVYAYERGILVGHFWAKESGPKKAKMWAGVEFGPNEALMCWGWVDQEWRGNGIFQALIAALARHVRTRNVAIRIVADVPVEPLASLVAHHRVGFRLCGKLSYTCLLGRLVSRKVEPLSEGDMGRILSEAEQRPALSN